MQKKTKQLQPLYSKEEWDALITKVLGKPNRCGTTLLPYGREAYLTPFRAESEVSVQNNPGRLILSLSIKKRDLPALNLGGLGMAPVSERTSAFAEIRSRIALRKLTPERAYELLVPHRAEDSALFPPHRALFVRTIRRFLSKV
jgi:hypothetical protein